MRILRFFLEMAATVCMNCGHNRTGHSRRKCEEPGCPCPVKYMDKDMFR